MRFYVFVIQQTVNGEDRQTFGYDTKDAAIQRYHALMSSAMAGTQISQIQVIVVNSDNGISVTDKWVRLTETANDNV